MTNVTHILTDSDTRSLGLDSLAARLQSQEREIRDLKSELRKTRSEQLIVGDGDGAGSQELQELREDLETLRSEIRGAKEAMERKSAAAGAGLTRRGGEQRGDKGFSAPPSSSGSREAGSLINTHRLRHRHAGRLKAPAGDSALREVHHRA